MKTFDCKRLWAIVVRDIVSERRRQLSYFLGVVLAFFFTEFSGLYYTLKPAHFPPLYGAQAATLLIVAACLFFIATSLTFSGLHSKQSRIALLMLPATNGEKFTARILATLLRFVVTVAAGLVVADLLRMLLFAIFGGDTTSLLPYVASQIWDVLTFTGVITGQHLALAVTGAVVSSLWLFSIFILGSAVFRKFAFFKTIATLLILSMLLGMIALPMVPYGSWRLVVWGNNLMWSDIMMQFITLVLTAFNFWLSYRCFTHMQVIARHRPWCFWRRRTANA